MLREGLSASPHFVPPPLPPGKFCNAWRYKSPGDQVDDMYMLRVAAE